MTIERRRAKAGVRYRAVVECRGRRYRGHWRETKRHALRDEADLLDARAQRTLRDEYGPDRIPTFAEAVGEYLRHCDKRVERGDEATSTVVTKRIHLNVPGRLLDRFGPVRLDEITEDQVEVCKRALYRDLAGPYVNRHLATLSGIFTFYRRRVSNPVASIKRYPENRDAWQAPGRDLVERIIVTARGSGNRHLAPIVLVCYEIAARVNEVRPLRWDQIDFGWCDRSGTKRGLVVWPRTKAGERQTAPLSMRAREELLQQRRRVEGPWYFPSPVQDAPISYVALRDASRVVIRDLEIGPLRIHDLRHARATELIGMDIASEKVQRVGRWKSHASMSRYIHMRADEAASAFEAAEALPDEATVTQMRQSRRKGPK